MFRNSYKSVGDGSEEEECKLGFRSLVCGPQIIYGGWKQISEQEHGQNVWDYQSVVTVQNDSNLSSWSIPSEPTKGFYFL